MVQKKYIKKNEQRKMAYPRIAKDKRYSIDKYYDLIYREPEGVPWRVKRVNRQLCDVLRLGNIAAPMRVLDLGCGAGKNTK